MGHLLFVENPILVSFKITIRVSNGLDPDQDQHFVSPDLDPNKVAACMEIIIRQELI